MIELSFLCTKKSFSSKFAVDDASKAEESRSSVASVVQTVLGWNKFSVSREGFLRCLVLREH